MTSSSDELNLAFQTIFRGGLKPTKMAMLQSFVPPLRVIVSCRPAANHMETKCGILNAENPAVYPRLIQKMQRDKKFADARTVMKRIGARLVRERKLALSDGDSAGDVENVRESGKDLLSLLVKANMTDPEGSSMSDEDVQDRESMFSLVTPDNHHAHTSLISKQKLPPLSLLVTRRAAQGSPGAFIVYPTISRHKSSFVTKSAN